MSTTAGTVAKVEIYNCFQGARCVGNGWMVVRYTADGRRMGTLKQFGSDEAGARAYAALWNGPDAR